MEKTGRHHDTKDAANDARVPIPKHAWKDLPSEAKRLVHNDGKRERRKHARWRKREEKRNKLIIPRKGDAEVNAKEAAKGQPSPTETNETDLDVASLSPTEFMGPRPSPEL
eukprot:8069460-Lingulodinium_polyedra.AAC.1